MKNASSFVCALLCAVSASAFAAPSLSLTLDPAAGPGKFASEEIRREAVAHGMTVVSTDAKVPADAIRITLTVGAPDHTPHIAHRGLKMNTPLDLRTSSYSDPSDSSQANIPEMWNMDFWRETFDDMARHRNNVISLWSLNPFPSIVYQVAIRYLQNHIL